MHSHPVIIIINIILIPNQGLYYDSSNVARKLLKHFRPRSLSSSLSLSLIRSLSLSFALSHSLSLSFSHSLSLSLSLSHSRSLSLSHSSKENVSRLRSLFEWTNFSYSVFWNPFIPCPVLAEWARTLRLAHPFEDLKQIHKIYKSTSTTGSKTVGWYRARQKSMISSTMLNKSWRYRMFGEST